MEEQTMYVIKEEKKSNTWKIVLIVLAVVAVVGAGVAAFLIWKKKKDANKQIEEEIDAAIDAAFAEEETAEVEVVEADA